MNAPKRELRVLGLWVVAADTSKGSFLSSVEAMSHHLRSG